MPHDAELSERALTEEQEAQWMRRAAGVTTRDEAARLHALLLCRGHDARAARELVVWTLYRLCEFEDSSYGAWAAHFETTRGALEEEYVRRIE
jgi:hypothetical protein